MEDAQTETHLTKREVERFLKLGKWAVAQGKRDDVTWEKKHAELLTAEVRGKLKEIDRTFDPYYPDTSYEEDVRAFVYDVERHIKGLPDPNSLEEKTNVIGDPPLLS